MRLNHTKVKMNKVFLTLYENKNIVLFSLSLGSIFCVFLKLIGFLSIFFQPLLISSTIFIILFIPSYPIFFHILNDIGLNFLEKLSLTIVINSVFYILVGYIGHFLHIPITGLFFLGFSFFSFVFFFIYIVIQELRGNSFNFFKIKKPDYSNTRFNENFSILKYLKMRIPLNGILVLIFIILVCIMNIVKVSYFPGTDPWLHIINSRIITDLNYLPLEKYHATLGFSIFGAVIHFFSGFNHVLIPSYFVFYTFLVSALIFYNISIRIFKNQNLAILSVFVLEFSSLGFSTMMIQYWPSGSALIKCLMIFFLLYIRIQNSIGMERPDRKVIFSHLVLYYILIALIFISAVLTHVVTSIFFLISFLWVYIIYFLKDYRRGIDLFLLSGLFGIFIIMNFFGIGQGHYWFFIPLNFSWYFLLSFVIIGGAAGIILFWKLQKTIKFTKGRFKAIRMGEGNKYYNIIEEKVIIPLTLSVLIIFAIFYAVIDFIWLNLGMINIFYIAEIILITIFAFWGLYIFKKKPRGQLLYIWGMGLTLLLAVGFIFNILVLNNMIWQRIFYLMPPVIVLGFSSYFYKLIRQRKIGVLRIKIVFLSIIISSLFITYIFESMSHSVFTLNKRELSPIQWYTNNTSKNNTLISEYGWNYVFAYYDYPFNNKTRGQNYEANFNYLKNDVDFFPPSNHYNESGVNILQEIKKQYHSDVFILFADDYVINKGFDLFGQLSEEELEEYYNLNYLNKICASSTGNGREISLYWVI